MPAASIHEFAMLLPSPIQAYFTERSVLPDVAGAEALHDGLQIGQHLAGVQQIGEAVDHRHASRSAPSPRRGRARRCAS